MVHSSMSHLEAINGDLLANIIARLDGLSLASLSCTSSDLRGIARHPTLWKRLCHSTWPSIALINSPSFIIRFDQFFADSYPLLFYDQQQEAAKLETSSTSPCDFVSLVDVYYKNQCVLSKVVHGIPEAAEVFKSQLMDSNRFIISSERLQWFLNCPFQLQLLDLTYDDDNLGQTNNNETSAPPEEDEKLQHHCKELTQDLRLSWIMLDKKTGKAVNLSSWKPLSVQSIWPHHGDYALQFGSIIPVEETVLRHKLARCKITTKFRVNATNSRIQWREISMSIENVTGALVDGKNSLMILSKALYSPRSTNQHKVSNGFNQYERQKKEIIKIYELRETLANRLYILLEITVFAFFCQAFTQLF